MADPVSRKHVGVALSRIQDTLIAAAGADARLSREEAESCLLALVKVERTAVDAFVGQLRLQGDANTPITVEQIKNTVATLRAQLGPAQGVNEVPAETVRQLSGMGDTLVRLAERLGGEPSAVLPALPKDAFPGLSGTALLDALRAWAAPHLELDYGTARDLMYQRVDAHGGTLHDVYADRDVPLQERALLERLEHINAEHTRPKSTGVGGTAAATDLHHLFPADQEANNRRGNLPFGEVVEVLWSKGASRLGTDAEGRVVFEPPDTHKGEVARALFYVAAVYGLPLPEHEATVLKRWHKLDPVSAVERARNDAISTFQENRNPFVDDPGLVDRVDPRPR